MRRGTWILALSGALALNQGSAFAIDPAFGDDESTPQTTRQAAPTGGIPSRYARKTDATNTDSRAADLGQDSVRRSPAAAANPQTKNYYSDLFTEQPAAAPKTSAASNAALGAWEDNAPESSSAPASQPSTQSAAKITFPAKPAPGRASVAQPAKPSTAAKAPTKTAVDAPAEARTTDAKPTSDAKPAADSRKFGASVRGVKSVDDTRVIHAAYDRMPPAAERKMIQQIRAESGQKTAAAPDWGSDSAPGVKPATSARPTEGPQTPQVTLEWVKKGDLNVGQECAFELHVKNNGTVAASQVAVDTFFPNTVRLTSADPKPVATTDRATWSFETIAPGAEHKITIKLIPSRRGDLGATANVRFTGAAAASFKVEEPLLKVALKGPAEVMLGDPASHQIIVSNPGTGTAHDVKVEARLSDGLEHGSRGERLVMEVGSIGPGETRTVRLGLSAVKGGHQSIAVTANSSSEASSTASAQVNIIAPSLKIAVEGPALRYKGRNAKFAVTVTNDGSVPNNNIRVNQAVGEGFKFVSADHNGKFDAATHNVQWFIGRLDPGQTALVTCELNACALGEFSQTATVLSDSGLKAEAKTTTKVDGVASLTMELVDLDDPVEIGAETAYEIRVRNEGSKAASGVSIACELPPEMELKTVKAPVDAIVEGRQILFKSLDHIPAGSQAIYKVHVKGVQEGTHRMRVRMTGASLQEPVVREEATKVYADSK